VSAHVCPPEPVSVEVGGRDGGRGVP
jgi:hypothetical protein